MKPTMKRRTTKQSKKREQAPLLDAFLRTDPVQVRRIEALAKTVTMPEAHKESRG